jgi:hypothetical protein
MPLLVESRHAAADDGLATATALGARLKQQLDQSHGKGASISRRRNYLLMIMLLAEGLAAVLVEGLACKHLAAEGACKVLLREKNDARQTGAT